MTCIAGIVDNGEVWMGGDSRVIQRGVVRAKRAPKFTRCGEALVGVTGDTALNDLLEFVFEPPEFPDEIEPRAYLQTEFLPAWRECLRAAGRLKIEDGEESMDGDMLVAMRGRLLNIGASFDTDESTDNYDAIGSGAAIAAGALFALNMPNAGKLSAKVRLRIALEATGQFSDSCGPPFHIERL